MSKRDDTLFEVTEVAVIRHRDLGVLLLHSEQRRWHFPDATVRVHERWDESLRDRVREVTGIDDLVIGPVLLIQNFYPGEVDERPQFGIFLSCVTEVADDVIGTRHRWARNRSDLDGLDLFRPLVANLVTLALDGSSPGSPAW